ncbi:WD40 repeat domain-containing protein [Streptomyces sp. NPDC019443]|uniref:WD40 repeat domain-containing protein n=1 Tax=Streptomyces sp. NPDC019443 TaxID=3365061 RepID=UPI00379E8160
MVDWLVRWSPDGRRIAIGDSDGNVRLFDAAELKPLRTLRGGPHRIANVEWSPSGVRIAASTYDGTVYIWRAGTGARVGMRTLNAVGRAHLGLVAGRSPPGCRRRLGNQSCVG